MLRVLLVISIVGLVLKQCKSSVLMFPAVPHPVDSCFCFYDLLGVTA